MSGVGRMTEVTARLRTFWRQHLTEDARDTIRGLLFFGYLFAAVVLTSVLFPW